jgi:hypothetical protein
MDKSKVNAGAVWWMLYAARWDNNSELGADKVKECLDEYWLKGETGGLADQFCNAANIGGLDNKAELTDEVNYTIYLLTGKSPAGFDANAIPPRWTLDD